MTQTSICPGNNGTLTFLVTADPPLNATQAALVTGRINGGAGVDAACMTTTIVDGNITFVCSGLPASATAYTFRAESSDGGPCVLCALRFVLCCEGCFGASLLNC